MEACTVPLNVVWMIEAIDGLLRLTDLRGLVGSEEDVDVIFCDVMFICVTR